MNLAVIGCGTRGHDLAAAAQSLGHTIAFCADSSRAAAARAAKRFGAKSTTRPLDAFSADALLVSKPAPADAATAIRALGRGIHVYWNAPLAHDLKQAHRLIAAARSGGAILASAYPARSCPQFAAAAGQVAANAIGTVGFIRVHRRAAHDSERTCAALDSLAGDFDWIASTFGPIQTVFAQLVRTPSVNSAMLTLTLAQGPIVQCVASVAVNVADSPRADVELCGQAGMIQFTTTDPIFTVDSHNAKSDREAASPLSPSVTERRLKQFFDTLAAGRMSAAQLKHETHVVRIVEAALKSARTDRAVKVPR